MYKEYENAKQTKQKLKKIFVMQATEHGITSVSVNTIIKIAGINRSTFYIHYHNLAELILDIEKDVLKRFERHLKQAQITTKQEFVNVVCDIAQQHASKIRFVVDCNCFCNMLNHTRDLLAKYIEPLVKPDENKITSTYISSGVVNVLRHCTLNNIDVNSVKNTLLNLIK